MTTAPQLSLAPVSHPLTLMIEKLKSTKCKHGEQTQTNPEIEVPTFYQSQNAKRASSQKRHMVISIFLLCNFLILMSIGAGSIRAIKGGLDKVFKIRDRLHRICRQILR